MKTMLHKIILFCLFVIIYTTCNSQTNNDSLKQIFSSKTFTLEEDYNGDWGGYWHKLTFTIQAEKVRIQWKNPELLKNGKDLEVILPIGVLKNLENIFLSCSTNIRTSKKLSTEHILYKFSHDNINYIIDDKFTMECYDEFKAWKEMILTEWKKQEKE